ncbi:MAG: type II toxin-antitoxin system VapC family toxin [Bacillota bacterium]
MMVYVDTSAFLAVLDADDVNHQAAKRAWIDLLQSGDGLVCNSYVLVETHALIQHRLGLAAVRTFHEDIFPVLRLEWIDTTLHQQAAHAVITANRKNLSLVDCASFGTMRRLGIKKAFTFDKHFPEQGFEIIPLSQIHM